LAPPTAPHQQRFAATDPRLHRAAQSGRELRDKSKNSVVLGADHDRQPAAKAHDHLSQKVPAAARPIHIANREGNLVEVTTERAKRNHQPPLDLPLDNRC
jgi:hypothetical protein